MSLLRWDDFTPPPMWHPSHRRHRNRFQQSPLFDFDETMKDVGKSFENALDLFNRPLATPEIMPKSPEKAHHRKMYKKKIPLVVRGVLAPDDIKVVLKDKVLEIEARKDQPSNDGSSRFYQEYHKSVKLPENIDFEDVRTVLTRDGFLRIEAPLKPIEEEKPQPQEIPIELSF